MKRLLLIFSLLFSGTAYAEATRVLQIPTGSWTQVCQANTGNCVFENISAGAVWYVMQVSAVAPTDLTAKGHYLAPINANIGGGVGSRQAGVTGNIFARSTGGRTEIAVTD